MLLQLDFSLSTPIYRQIRDQIVQGIAQGKLTPGQRLPSVRALASECGVNAMTVSKAYQLLKQEGYVRGDRRGGTFVSAPDGAAEPDPAAVEKLRQSLAELVAGGMTPQGAQALCARLIGEVSPPTCPPTRG